jgi:antitoxin (DNA-binding transcriptional repressor) of toxin-antitoxin stability system
MCIAAISSFALLTTPIVFLGQQQPTCTPGSDVPDQHTENTIRVPDGTVVRLLVTDAISGKTAKSDGEVHVRVIDEVKAGDLVVVANRAPACAHIAALQHARRSLRAGRMTIKLDSVALVTGQTQKLRGLLFKGGDFSGKASNVDVDPYLLVLSLPFLPFAHGDEAYLPKGTVLTAALDGDALLDRTSVLAHQPPHSPKEGPASITFYWLFAQGSRHSRVFCGTVKMGDLSQGHNFTVHLPPGNYWFRLQDKKKAIRVALAPGSGYFLRLSPFSRNHLEPVEHDIGEVEVTESQTLAKRKIVDVSTASLSDLQADPRNR